MALTVEQIRAARAFLGWGQKELADHADLSKTAIANIENGKHRPTAKNAEAIRNAFEVNGLEFIDEGVRKRKEQIEILEGMEGVRKFYRSVMSVAASEGGEFCVYGVDEKDFTDMANRAGINEEYRKTMSSLVDRIHFYVLISENDTNTYSAAHCTYRKLPDEQIHTKAPFYIYGNNLALIVWRESPKFIIISDEDLVSAYRSQFKILWHSADDIADESEVA